MSLKDRFDRFIDYFTEDEDLSLPNEKRDEPILTPVNSTQEKALSTNQTPSTSSTKENNITRLHARQQELAKQNQHSTEKVTIDVRYPRKYEDAIEIVDLLAGNESILIDFQYMTEVQARRCLDYLDGAPFPRTSSASTFYNWGKKIIVFCFQSFLPPIQNICRISYQIRTMLKP